ncbi:hypothetical protein Tco_0575830 [Tanacetum coccineum]
MSSISMRWFNGGEFPRDSLVDGFDVDMTLETLLNVNPTRIRKYPEEFLVLIGLSHMDGLGSWKAPMPVSFIVSPLCFAVATKAEEFIPVVTSCPTKRFKSSLNSGRSGVSKKPVGYKVGSGHLVTSTKLIRTATYLAYTHSQLLVPTHSSPLPSSISRHILGIIPALVEDSTKTHRQDNYFASICVDPFMAKDIYQLDWELTNDFIKGTIARLKKLVEEKPSGEVARLRLGKEEVDREETELSTVNGTYADLLREKIQLEYQNSKIWSQVDGEVEMDREHEVEITLTIRDAIETKKWVVSKGFRYFLNKFKDNDLLGTCLGACISATIIDGMRQALRYLEACVDEKISYIRALLVMEVDEPKKDEVATIENPASGSASSAGGGVE